jgi:hypothetical protein
MGCIYILKQFTKLTTFYYCYDQRPLSAQANRQKDMNSGRIHVTAVVAVVQPAKFVWYTKRIYIYVYVYAVKVHKDPLSLLYLQKTLFDLCPSHRRDSNQ